MFEENMNGYLGHSNDSLFASADEMAGDYSPHNDNNGFTPVQYIPTQSSSYTSNDRHSPDAEDLEINYPMPDELEIWKQAEHPDSINKILNMTGDLCMEMFRGAAKMLSHANPETFDMPLEARFICMKVDRDADMRYALSTGTVTNLPSCNERINKVWRERNGQRVFMMFSISGQKEFCAMAEMLGPVAPGSMPGWTKAGCEGLVFLTFIYVKNVPFSLINHIKHKSNRQPVANMWNSMMYHDNTGYHVARIYCEHPVLSSVLVRTLTETQSNYKSQLRIPASGNSAYSASSYGSNNDKYYDPRSATKLNLHRSGNRNQRNNTNRYALQWRRQDNMPPTPSRQPDRFVEVHDATPTPVTSQRRNMLPSNTAGAAQSPPPFKISGSARPSGVIHPARSFTTADDRMIAEYASSRDAKRSKTSQSSSSSHQAEATSHDPFHVGRTLQDGQHHTPSPIGTQRLDVNHISRNGHYQGGPHAVQWQGDGRTAQVPVFLDQSFAGLGITSGTSDLYNRQRQLMYSNGNGLLSQSPATSSQSSHQGSSSRSREVRRQQSQGFALPSPPSFNNMRPSRGHGHPAPQSRSRQMHGAVDPSYTGHRHVAKPGNPIKHSQSMPVMMPQVSHRLSAESLHAHNSGAKTNIVKTVVSTSPGIQEWVITTPTRATAGETEQPPGTSLTVKTTTDPGDSPEKAVRSADLADKLKWHKAMAVALELEVKMAQGSGHSMTEKQDLIQWHNAKAACLEVEIIAVRREHSEARGELAQETANHRPASPGTPSQSANWPKWATNSATKSGLVTPEADEHGNALHLASKAGEEHATHVGQKLRHRRGDISNGGFTGSFHARASANVEDLLSSPARSNAYPANNLTYTHGHPKQDTSVRQHDSCTEDQPYSGDERYSYRELDDNFEFASQIDPLEYEGEVFSPRGRGYHHSQPTRDDSQISHGGIELGDEHGRK